MYVLCFYKSNSIDHLKKYLATHTQTFQNISSNHIGLEMEKMVQLLYNMFMTECLLYYYTSMAIFFRNLVHYAKGHKSNLMLFGLFSTYWRHIYLVNNSNQSIKVCYKYAMQNA